METQFEITGYNIDYYVGTRYMGSVPVSEPDREVIGYNGRQVITLTQDLVIGKKKIKSGTVVKTELQKVCGRIK